MTTDKDLEYSVDMSLTNFWKFFTHILLQFWIVTSCNEIPLELATLLFDLLTSCQVVRILNPTFQEEHFLLSMILLIISHCYDKMMGEKHPKMIKKLRNKITML